MPCMGQRTREPEHSYAFKVELEDLNYAVRNRTGRRTYGSGYEELAIQEALNSLTNARTWQEKVLLKGNFPDLGNSIIVPSYTLLLLDGKVTATPDPNFPMLINADQVNGNSHVTIEGGEWDGNNGAARVAGADIIQIRSTDNPCMYNRIRNLTARHANDTVLHFFWNIMGFVENINGITADGRTRTHGMGIDATGGYDMFYKGIFMHSTKVGFFGLQMDAGDLSNFYLGGSSNDAEGQLFIQGGWNHLNNIRVDSSGGNGVQIGRDGWVGQKDNVISNLTITSPYVANKTALLLQDALDTMISNLRIGLMGAGHGGVVWADGIKEDAGTLRSLYSNINVDATTPVTLDATSHYHTAYLNGAYTSVATEALKKFKALRRPRI